MHNSLCIFKKVRKYILRFLEIQALKRDRNHCFTPSAGIHENHLALYIYPRTEFRLPETQLSEPTMSQPDQVNFELLISKSKHIMYQKLPLLPNNRFRLAIQA